MGDLILKELLQQAGSETVNVQQKRVCFFVNATEYEYTGDWQWNLQCDAVFCSDVMLCLPAYFEGTRGIIHPDDKAPVLQQLTNDSQQIPFLQFRIITTYGDVKVLTGRNLQAALVTSLLGAAWQLPALPKPEARPVWQFQKVILQKRAAERSEWLSGSGSWYYETESNRVFYSDAVFRIFGLPRESLNHHLHTFTPFIHPDDRELVGDMFTKALREQLPLHLDYRIVLHNGQEKNVRQVTRWEFNDQGGRVLYGTIQDITEQHAERQQAQHVKYELQLLNRLLQLQEQTAHLGHWSINLATRKLVFSDNVYRLHGAKPGTLPAGTNIIRHFVHPDDCNRVQDVYEKMLQEHTPPEIAYRIVRPDGKVRHLRQRSRLVEYAEGEMLLLVTLQDVTTEINIGQQVVELKQQVSVQQAVQQQAEELGIMGSWIWEPETDKIVWSENLYNLLGIKPSASDPTQKHLLHAIHPEDRNRFEEQLLQTIQGKQERNVAFRITRFSETRQVSATLRIITDGGTERVVGTLRDVSQHAHLQNELSLQAQQIASITGNMLDRAVITDLHNTIRFWNRKCEQAYGLKKETVLGKNIFDVFPQLKNEADLVLFNRALNGETVSIAGSKAILRREYHDLHLIPLRDEHDKVTGILHLIHDVTREHEMQRRLTERLNFIESLVEASVDRIVVMDRYMNYLYCNQKAADHFGLSKEEIIGKNVLEIFPKSVNDPSHEHFKKALKGETVHIPATEDSSTEQYFEVFLIPILNESSQVSAVLWIHHDLSGEINVQKQLRKSDEVLKAVNAAIIELDGDYRFRYINPAAEAMLLQKKETLVGRSMWEVFQNAIGQPDYEPIIKANTEKIKVEVEYLSAIYNRWIFMSVVPMADGVLLFQYDRQDIREAHEQLQREHKELKEAQGALQSFHKQWQQLLENTPDIITRWNADLRLLSYNSAFLKVTGITVENPVGKNHGELGFGEKESRAFIQDLMAVIESGQTLVRYMDYKTPDGEKHFQTQLFPEFGATGTVVAVGTVTTDITELKESEKELLQIKNQLAQQAAGDTYHGMPKIKVQQRASK